MKGKAICCHTWNLSSMKRSKRREMLHKQVMKEILMHTNSVMKDTHNDGQPSASGVQNQTYHIMIVVVIFEARVTEVLLKDKNLQTYSRIFTKQKRGKQNCQYIILFLELKLLHFRITYDQIIHLLIIKDNCFI